MLHLKDRRMEVAYSSKLTLKSRQCSAIGVVPLCPSPSRTRMLCIKPLGGLPVGIGTFHIEKGENGSLTYKFGKFKRHFAIDQLA